MTTKPKLQPCVDCGREVREVSTRDEHAPDCPHWAALNKTWKSDFELLERLASYAKFLSNPPPLLPGSQSFEAGLHAATTSIGQTLALLLKGEDVKLLQWTEGNEPLRKALGLKL